MGAYTTRQAHITLWNWLLFDHSGGDRYVPAL